MTKDLLIKFLNNNCTKAELQEVLFWAEKEALTDKGRELGFEDWMHYKEDDGLEDDERFIELFDRIQEKIDEQDKPEGKGRTITSHSFKEWLTRAAAILLIPVLAFLFYTLSENRTFNLQYATAAVDSLEIIAPIGSRTVVQLSDGTTVHLNYGSRLKYPHFFLGNTREVELQGEGFFEVAHNPEKPFIVKTGKLNVKALGTAFNVMAYPENAEVQTTLINGKVVLEEQYAPGELHTLGSMEPGQHVAYNKETGAVVSKIGTIDKYVGWKEGKLIFEDTPILEVAERLSRMFNVNIQVDTEIEDYVYTVTFIDEPLFQILDLMTIATPVTYTVIKRIKLPDETYSRQKIIIEKKE